MCRFHPVTRLDSAPLRRSLTRIFAVRDTTICGGLPGAKNNFPSRDFSLALGYLVTYIDLVADGTAAGRLADQRL